MFCKYLRLISVTWFGWFVEKLLSMLSSSWWWMHVPRPSANKAYKTNSWQKFPILLALDYYTFMCTIFINMNTYILTEGRNFKTFWKARKLFWTVFPCLILNMELNLILILLIEFACIRQSWTLQQINLTVC